MSDCDEGMTETVAEAQAREKAGTPRAIAQRIMEKEGCRLALVNLRDVVKSVIVPKHPCTSTTKIAANSFAASLDVETSQTVAGDWLYFAAPSENPALEAWEKAAGDPMSRKL